ncbi:MAG: TfoX/Sxy family protein [Roseinatronobacter sp.]
MATPISALRNLGPAMEAACAGAGIASAEMLRDLGTDAAYARLLAAGEKPHFISYYVLEMALQGRPWNDCKGPEKERLRARFDRLKAEHVPRSHPIDAILDEIGVRSPVRKAL